MGSICLDGCDPPTTPLPFAYALLGHCTSLNVWHTRLGHPSDKIVHQIVSQFSLPVSSQKSVSICGSCQMGKIHRFHLSSSHDKSSPPFALVYFDAWGPSPIPSTNGS